MTMMTMCVRLPDNVELELTGDNAKLWLGCGLPDYEGPIDGLQETHPAILQQLLDGGYIKPK